MKYVNLPRKKLTEHICIDEVYLNISPTCKYALVIMDFVTGDIIDIIESRRKTYTESYFLSIPLEEGAAKRLDELIQIYKNSSIQLFRQFLILLIKYRDSIMSSFTYVKSMNEDETIIRRLSNGPLESFNNIPSKLRTQSHGVDNFTFTRNRILWAIRDDAPILGNPRDENEIHRTGKKRGNYNKK